MYDAPNKLHMPSIFIYRVFLLKGNKFERQETKKEEFQWIFDNVVKSERCLFNTLLKNLQNLIFRIFKKCSSHNL